MIMQRTVEINSTYFYQEPAETPDGDRLDHGIILIPQSSDIVNGNNWILEDIATIRRLIQQNLLVDAHGVSTADSRTIPMISTGDISETRICHNDHFQSTFEAVLLSGHGDRLKTASAKAVNVIEAMKDSTSHLPTEYLFEFQKLKSLDRLKPHLKKLKKYIAAVNNNNKVTIRDFYASYAGLLDCYNGMGCDNPYKEKLHVLLRKLQKFHALMTRKVARSEKDWDTESPSTLMLSVAYDASVDGSIYVHWKDDPAMGTDNFTTDYDLDRLGNPISTTLLSVNGEFANRPGGFVL